MLHSSGVKSVFLSPILSGNVLWGFVCFTDHHRERHFDNESAEMMRSAAFFIANAIIRAEMEREIIEKNELNHVMFDAAPIGLAMFDESCRVIDCNDAILKMLGVSKENFLDHFDELSPEYQPNGLKSRDRMRDLMQQTFNGEHLTMEWTLVSSAAEMIPCELTLASTAHQGKSIGLGYVYDLRNVKKMEESIQRLESEVVKIYDDPLTGIHNRRYFDENLERVIKSLARTGGTLSLLMVDIDHFKRFNDTYGHLEGDQCLKTVAAVLVQSIMRADDFVARYGGEEFAVVLPHTDEHGARMVAEKMCENVRNRHIPHKKNELVGYVTISIGGTTGRVERTQTGEDYIKRADEMLYLSKQNGRNRYSDDFVL
jgi:diguanylate cyclase (GGDEF)-like protein